MSKRKVYPQTRQQEQGIIQRVQGNFVSGMVKDIDARDIPADAVTDMVNMRGFNNGARGRIGSRIFTTVQLPYCDGVEDGIICSKVGKSITTSSDFTFSTDHVGCYFVWPYSTITPPENEYISNVSVDELGAVDGLVTDYDNTARTDVAGCHIRARLNASFFDSTHGNIYILCGRYIYCSAVGYTLSWKKITQVGTTDQQPTNSFSRFVFINNFLYLLNGGGIYRISAVEANADNMYFWKCNDVCPSINKKIVEVLPTSHSPCAYRYIYTYSRFKGAMLGGDRRDADKGVVLEWESCPPLGEQDEEDYSTVYTKYPAGKYKIINSGNIANKLGTATLTYPTPLWMSDPEYWRLRGESSLGVRVVMPGGKSVVHKVYPSFKTVQSMDDVAKEMQKAIRVYIPSVFVYFVSNTTFIGSAFFSIYSLSGLGEIDGFEAIENTTNSVGYSRDITSDTSLGDGQTKTEYSSGNAIHGMSMPVVYINEKAYPASYTPTHYSIYRTQDVSVAISDTPDSRDPRIANNPQLFVWVADIPICKPFMADIGALGLLAQPSKTLTIEDVGGMAVVNGEFVDILEMLDDYTFRVAIHGPSAGAPYVYPAITNGYVHGLLGAGHSFVASKASDTITATNWEFSSENVGQNIFWSDGSISIVKSVSEAGVAKTVDTDDKEEQAAAINAKSQAFALSRSFYDTVDDQQLMSRIKSWPLESRYYKRMPDTCFGAVVQGFLVIANKDFGDLYYCSTEKAHQIGYYHGVGQHNKKIQDGITSLKTIKDNVIIFCKYKTYRLNPQHAIIMDDTTFGESYLNMGDPTLINGTIGVPNDTSSVEVEDGTHIVWTTDNTVRLCDGNQFSEDLAYNKIAKSDLSKMSSGIIMDYDNIVGLTMWGVQEPTDISPS